MAKKRTNETMGDVSQEGTHHR